jgi:hypothetical protein
MDVTLLIGRKKFAGILSLISVSTVTPVALVVWPGPMRPLKAVLAAA